MTLPQRGLLLLFLSFFLPALADTPGRHPRYLQALSDLRFARALLNRPEEIHVARDQAAAIAMINRAIEEIKHASYDDRKPLNAHAPVDAGFDRPGRLRKALEVLRSALRDIEEEEDNPAARGWRNVAIRYIRDAIGDTERAIRDRRRL